MDDLVMIVRVLPLIEGPDSDHVAAWRVGLCGPEDVRRLSRGVRRDGLFNPRVIWNGPWMGPSWSSPADIYKDLDDLGWSAVEWRPNDFTRTTSVWSHPGPLTWMCP
jgi:hypothetical protein